MNNPTDPRTYNYGSFGVYLRRSRTSKRYHLKYAMATQSSAESKARSTVVKLTDPEKKDVPLDWCEVIVAQFNPNYGQGVSMPSPVTLQELRPRLLGISLVTQRDFEGSFLYNNTNATRRLCEKRIEEERKTLKAIRRGDTSEILRRRDEEGSGLESPRSRSAAGDRSRKRAERPAKKPSPVIYHSAEFQKALNS